MAGRSNMASLDLHCPVNERPVTDGVRLERDDGDPKESCGSIMAIEMTTGTRFNTTFHQLRWAVIFLTGFNNLIMMYCRFSISISLVNMTKQAKLATINRFSNQTSSADLVEIAEFDWDNTVQLIILSVYMISYAVLQVPLAFLIEKRGGHTIATVSHLVAIVATIGIPLMAGSGWGYVALMRFLVGGAHAALATVPVHMVGYWLQADEITIGVTISQFLACIGIMLYPIATGYLASIHWTMAFYMPCVAITIWLVLWVAIVRADPSSCWLISAQELQLIERNRRSKVSASYRGPKIWLRVLKMPRLYAFLFLWGAVTGTATCFNFIIPNYLEQMTSIKNVQESGLIVFLIQCGAIVSYIWGLKLLYGLLGAGWSMTSARRLVYTISIVVSGFAWLSSWPSMGMDPFWMCLINRVAHPVSEIIIISTIVDNFAKMGLSTAVFGIVNTIGNSVSFPMSITIGYYLDSTSGDPTTWSTIFVCFLLFNVLGLITYLVWIDSRPIEFLMGIEATLKRQTNKI